MPVFMTFIDHTSHPARVSFPAGIPLYDGKQGQRVQLPMSGPEGGKSAEDAVKRRIREAGKRARAEADARRQAQPDADARAEPAPKEINGRDGPDPVRHGDWEVKGIASDF
jgi:hypothetical protein